MTDRELLELAAKASGVVHPVVLAKHLGSVWNPRGDDGDALRLAVQLRIGVQCHGATVVTIFDNAEPDVGLVPQRRTHIVKGDPHAATRLAILLAAAEIGLASAPPPPKAGPG